MVSKLSNRDVKNAPPSSSVDEVTVYGRVDAQTVVSIDRVADQMLMPRSWVVSQILREWSERRSVEVHALEESWDGSYREHLGERGLDILREAGAI